MKYLKLSNSNLQPVVDDEDYDRLSSYTWYLTNHRGINIHTNVNGKIISLARVILQSMQIVDHIDRNGLNNCRSNLRKASLAQNSWNRIKQSNCKSGYKGVCNYPKRTDLWRVQIMANGIKYNLGVFKSKHTAALAYNYAAMKYHGEFAVLNKFPFITETLAS